MAGRQKLKIRVYNSQGHFIEEHSSQTECLFKYFPKDVSKRPLLVHTVIIFSLYHNKELIIRYGTIDNEYYFFDQAIYREDVVYIHKIATSKYCRQNEKEKIIEVYNIQNEKIAEFKSLRLLTKLMPHISQSVISRQLDKKNKKIKRHKGLEEDLFFKYKN